MFCYRIYSINIYLSQISDSTRLLYEIVHKAKTIQGKAISAMTSSGNVPGVRPTRKDSAEPTTKYLRYEEWSNDIDEKGLLRYGCLSLCLASEVDNRVSWKRLKLDAATLFQSVKYKDTLFAKIWPSAIASSIELGPCYATLTFFDISKDPIAFLWPCLSASSGLKSLAHGTYRRKILDPSPSRMKSTAATGGGPPPIASEGEQTRDTVSWDV